MLCSYGFFCPNRICKCVVKRKFTNTYSRVSSRGLWKFLLEATILKIFSYSEFFVFLAGSNGWPLIFLANNQWGQLADNWHSLVGYYFLFDINIALIVLFSHVASSLSDFYNTSTKIFKNQKDSYFTAHFYERNVLQNLVKIAYFQRYGSLFLKILVKLEK